MGKKRSRRKTCKKRNSTKTAVKRRKTNIELSIRLGPTKLRNCFQRTGSTCGMTRLKHSFEWVPWVPHINGKLPTRRLKRRRFGSIPSRRRVPVFFVPRKQNNLLGNNSGCNSRQLLKDPRRFG